MGGDWDLRLFDLGLHLWFLFTLARHDFTWQ